MSLGQFIVVILLIIGAALIGGLYKFLPPKPARAILASLIFGFDAILLTSVIKGCIGGALFAR
ncbi:MAG: hypothetical protein LBG88_00165, partial [Christensenellaceae bacterium]|nr:hypothetical protein [Christensenellaceae bacterium]